MSTPALATPPAATQSIAPLRDFVTALSRPGRP